MQILFREGLEDRDYLNEFASDWQQLREHALRPEHSPERAAAITGISVEAIEALALAYGRAGRDGRAPAAIRLNYGIQRAENGGTAARAVAMLPLITGSWRQHGGGLLLSTSAAFPFEQEKLHMPELMKASPLGRAARTVNMNQLGDALTQLGRALNEIGIPPVKALFVYNCNAAAVAPDSERVHEGLRRDDLFVVVHEQFFTDTTDYADIVLPATTFLEHKELMGAYGHYFAQISQPAIAPLGEARMNVQLFAELGRRMGFEEQAFREDADDLIAQALDSKHPWFEGITKDRLEREGMAPLALPRNNAGESLPFSTHEWFQTPDRRANLLPLPEWHAATESRSNTEAAAKFPLEMLARKGDNYMNTTFANLPNHRKMESRTAGVIEMRTEDARARGICSGDTVRVWNDRGQIQLTARMSESIPAGTVASQLDWQKLSHNGVNVNELTSQRLTDIGGGATFYSTLVEVSKLELSPLA
jgi:anaerobic selenocysteine-containing dehydrogenase